MGSLKNPIFRGGWFMKSEQTGGLPKKEGLGQFADLRGSQQKRGGCVFEGVDTPMYTIVSEKRISRNLLLTGQHLLEQNYFRCCFSLICSVYDLTVIKKSHTLNCYWFLQKFFLKTQIYTDQLLATTLAQFATIITNQEKAINFLSLMSQSINN